MLAAVSATAALCALIEACGQPARTQLGFIPDFLKSATVCERRARANSPRLRSDILRKKSRNIIFYILCAGRASRN
jgi:hypothetical protein